MSRSVHGTADILEIDGRTPAVADPSREGGTGLLRDWRCWFGIWAIAAQLLTAHPGGRLLLLSLAAWAIVSACAGTAIRRSPADLRLLGVWLFCTAYLVSPYWTIAGWSSPAEGMCRLVGAGALAVLWSLCGARPVERSAGPAVPAVWALLPVLVTLLLMWPSLCVSLAWRGDEDYHLTRLWALQDALGRVSLGSVLPIVLLVGLVVAWGPGKLRGSTWRWPALAVALAWLTWQMAASNAGGDLDAPLCRYPFILVWAQALLTWCVRAWDHAVATEPGLSRLLPAISLVLVVLFVVWQLQVLRPTKTQRVLLPIAVATIPNLLFYGTLNYLELPVVLLMLCVCWDADRLFDAYLDRRALGPAWLGLLALPFLKETTLVFSVAVLVFVGGLVIYRAIRAPHLLLPGLRRWVNLGVILLVPVALYLGLRARSGLPQHGFLFYPPNFIVPSLYVIFFKALWQQYGLLLPLALVGTIYAIRHRPRLVGFCAIVLVGYFLFANGNGHRRVRVGQDLLPGYAGYSRFMLYLLPPLLALAWQGVVALVQRRRAALTAAAGLWLAGNLCMSPMRPDGSRVLGWGDHVIDTQDHAYPYAALYAWLGEETGGRPAGAVIIGRRYGYDVGDRLYRQRFGLDLEVQVHAVEVSPKLTVGQAVGGADLLDVHFSLTAQHRPDYIIVHQPVWGPRWTPRPSLQGYNLARTFQFGGLSLFAYQLQADDP